MPRVIGLFQSQFRVDLCVGNLESHGFTASDVGIILFSVGERQKPTGLLGWISQGGLFGDTMDQSDGLSTMDGMTVAAAIGALWGIVWGSRLPWGPITVGLFGLLAGGLVGLIIDRLIPEKRRDLYHTNRLQGLILVEVITGDLDRSRIVEQIMKRSQADQVAISPH